MVPTEGVSDEHVDEEIKVETKGIELPPEIAEPDAIVDMLSKHAKLRDSTKPNDGS